jgi:alpha,alpha-trehalase
MNKENIVTENALKAVVFDIDAILDRELLHKTIWIKILNDFLVKFYPEKDLVSEEEYSHFIEGKTKIERIKNFLDSREINLSFGGREDSPGDYSICALENQKSRIFNQTLTACFNKKPHPVF